VAFLSPDDALMRGRGASFPRRLARLAVALGAPGAARILVRLRQRRVEAAHAVARRDLLEADKSLQDILALSGRME
jgi:hypothetical protein